MFNLLEVAINSHAYLGCQYDPNMQFWPANEWFTEIGKAFISGDCKKFRNHILHQF